MRTIFVYGTDIHGPEPWWDNFDWVERPWTDGGRLKWAMDDRPTMDELMYQAAGVAGIDSLAILLRGFHHGGFATKELKASIEEYAGPFANGAAPTLCPFIDTGGLSWNLDPEVPFDFANQAHLERFWTHFLKPFYDQFREGQVGAVRNPIRFERSKNGKLVIVFWGINQSGKGIRHQDLCQRLLDLISARMVQAGLGEPDCIVDQSWLKYAPGLKVFGVHAWFAAADHIPSTVYTHSNGIVCGATCPGFHVADQPTWVISRNDGATLRNALKTFRAVHADYAILEGFTDVSESAGYYRSASWSPDTLYLDIVREHIQAGRPVPVPTPIPVPTHGGTMTGLLLNGEYLSIDPASGPTFPVHRSSTLGIKEDVAFIPHGAWVEVVFTATQRRLTINPQGGFESRALTDALGAWEQIVPSADTKFISRAGVTLAIVTAVEPPPVIEPDTDPLKDVPLPDFDHLTGKLVGFAMKPLLAFRYGDLIDVGDGWSAILLGGDLVLSVQRDGSLQTRPKSQIGSWEKCRAVDRFAVYMIESKIYAFPLIEGLLQ